jgi:hypothetical protein
MRVEPGLVSVKDLLLKVHSGNWSLWLPSFQRRFVWDPVDIKAFLDSLFKGNPLGILLLGRSKNPEDSDPFALRVRVGEGEEVAKGAATNLIHDLVRTEGEVY